MLLFVKICSQPSFSMLARPIPSSNLFTGGGLCQTANISLDSFVEAVMMTNRKKKVLLMK